MATAWGEPAAYVRPATCVRHPDGSNEFHFCFDCSRVFCGDCRSNGIERVNHLPHRTAPLQGVLDARKQRMSAVRKLIKDYTNKHDTTLTALLQLEEEQKKQTDELNGVIDEFAAQLIREVENMKTQAKVAIEKRASALWSANPSEIRRKEISTELEKMREVRAAIDHEVRLCDRDELYLLEKHKDLETFAGELSEFQKKTFDIPDTKCYQLTDLRRELLRRMSRMQNELNRAKDAFLKALHESLPFFQPVKLSLLTDEVITFPKVKLLCPNDTNKSPGFCGAIPAGDNIEVIYFVDVDNSKIKSLDLKTNQLADLFSGPSGTQLYGLANVDETSKEPLIATTEHTTGTPAKVRLLFLRRNSPGIIAGSLDVVQSVDLDETTSHWTSIAQSAGGNLFCAVWDSDCLHELCRSSADASPTAFESTARTHRLPAKAIAICSVQTSGECRLVTSLQDDSLRVFRVAGGSLCELQRVPSQSDPDWRAVTLVALPGGSLAMQSYFTDKSTSKWTFGIECCAEQPDGSLAALKRLHSQELLLFVIGLLQPTDSSPTFRLITVDCDSESNEYQHISLSLYPMQTN